MIRIERRRYPLRFYIYLTIFRFEPGLRLLIFLGLTHPWLRILFNKIVADDLFNYRIELIEKHGYTQEQALEYDPIPF